jgi:hypothetical protein
LAIFLGLEIRIQRTSWKAWKARPREGTAEVNELEERESSSPSLSNAALIIHYSRIWEKKYGKGAKHVIKRREEEAEKNKMKEEKRRQRETASKRPRWATKNAFEPPKQTDSGYGGRTVAKSDRGNGGGKGDEQPLPKKSRREDKPLHPSWEAKKKMKKKESAAIMPPVGKKIVF